MKLTDRTIRAAIIAAREVGAAQWKHEPRGRGRGALSLKASPGGAAHWYYRYSLDRRQQYVVIGPYGNEADALSLAEARVRCDVLAEAQAGAPRGDLRALLAARKADEERDHRAAVAASAGAERGTLAALMAAYAADLERRGKATTATDLRRLVALHIVGEFPELARAQAAAVTSREAAQVLRRLVEAGKGRTAGKLRAFMHAAYAQALRAETDAAVSESMLAFSVPANPIGAVATLPQFNTARTRALTETELRALWVRLNATDTPSAVAVRLALLLGGQRFEQLLSARVERLDRDAGTLTLFDAKGRRKTPREHVLPCPPAALALLDRRATVAAALGSPWLFPAADGAHMTPATASKYLQVVRAAMVKAGESADFMLADLRRTAETRMAELGVSKDTRAQIQSHGLGGVQARHYDRHDYLREKRAALAAWESWLTGTPAAIVRPIRAAAPA